MNGKNLHLPVPPGPRELRPKQASASPGGEPSCEEGWREEGARMEGGVEEKELARGGPDPEEGGRKSQEERLETKRKRLAGKPPRRQAVGTLGWTESHPIRMEARTVCV